MELTYNMDLAKATPALRREVAAAARGVIADAMGKESSPSVGQLAALASKRRLVAYVPELLREALDGVDRESTYAFWLTQAKVANIWPVTLGGDQAVYAARILAEPIAARLAALEDAADVWADEDYDVEAVGSPDDYPDDLDAPHSIVDEDVV